MSSLAQAQQRSELQPLFVRQIRAVLKKPEVEIDLTRVKLIIDKLIDPDIDAESASKRLDSMIAEIKSRLPVNATSRDKMEALRAHLYQPGPWNGNQPYHYDFDDPLGTNIRSKLLPVYLSTKKGNCVSMPLLFVILGQKLGVDVTIATAPLHVLVKYRNDAGIWYDFEATSNGFAVDATYQRQYGITPEAMANQIYLKPLTKRETASVMMETVMEFFHDQGREDERIAMANLALEYHPKNVSAMVHQASASVHLINAYKRKYPNPRDLPKDKQMDFIALQDGVVYWYRKAESLGWYRPGPEVEASYLQMINRVKVTQ